MEHSMPSSVIPATSFFRYRAEKQTDRQTNKHINAAETPTNATTVRWWKGSA